LFVSFLTIIMNIKDYVEMISALFKNSAICNDTIINKKRKTFFSQIKENQVIKWVFL